MGKQMRDYEFRDAERYRRGYLKKLDDGRYRGILRFKDEDGRWKQKTRCFDSTKLRESERLLDEFQEELESEYRQEVERRARLEDAEAHPTVSQACQARIGEARAKGSAPSTIRNYEAHSGYIGDAIGGIPVEDLTEDDVISWIGGMREDGYADCTIKNALGFLRSSIDRQVRKGVVSDNVAEDVKVSVRSKKPNVLGEEEVAKVYGAIAPQLEGSDPRPSYVGIVLDLDTGMREGEVCGLRWRNLHIDDGNAYLDVSESIRRGGDGRFEPGPPKTESSRRSIDLEDGWLVSLLRKRRESQRVQAEAVGIQWDTSFYVIGDAAGGFMSPMALLRDWKGLADYLDLVGTQGERPTFHDLRHTYATLAIKEGTDVKAVSANMGHADAAMTMNIYADCMPDSKRMAAAKMAGIQERIRERAGIQETRE